MLHFTGVVSFFINDQEERENPKNLRAFHTEFHENLILNLKGLINRASQIHTSKQASRSWIRRTVDKSTRLSEKWEKTLTKISSPPMVIFIRELHSYKSLHLPSFFLTWILVLLDDAQKIPLARCVRCSYCD